MFYYSYYSGHGRANLSDALGAEDPFVLAPDEIVERVISAGYKPCVDRPRAAPWLQIGRVTEIERGNRTFLVAVSRDVEEISVQEIRSQDTVP